MGKGKKKKNRGNGKLKGDVGGKLEESFFKLGVHGDACDILRKKSITRPTKIQSVAIPLILKDKDVLLLAKRGSGKTLACLISISENMGVYFSDPDKLWEDPFTSVIIIVPTAELCQQTFDELKPFLELFSAESKLALLKSTTDSELDALLAEKPDFLVSTPDCVLSCLAKGFPRTEDSQRLLRCVIIDEIDLLLSNGYEDDLKSIVAQLPRSCQFLLVSDNPSADVGRLKSFAVNNPYVVTLSEVGDVKVEVSPYNVEQFYIACSSSDKLPIIAGLLLCAYLCERVVIFTNSIHMSERLRFLVEQFDCSAAVVNPGLSPYFHLKIIKDFNGGRIDLLIIASDVYHQTSRWLDWEAGVLAEIDLNSVDGVVNFDMPRAAVGYARRVDRTGRARTIGISLSLVSPEEMGILTEVRSSLGDKDSKIIAPYGKLSEFMMKESRAAYECLGKMLVNLEAECEKGLWREFVWNGRNWKGMAARRGL